MMTYVTTNDNGAQRVFHSSSPR